MFLEQIDEMNKHLTNIALMYGHTKIEMYLIIRSLIGSATNMEKFSSGVKHSKNQYCY